MTDLRELAERAWRGELDTAHEHHPVHTSYDGASELAPDLLALKGIAGIYVLDTGDGLVMLDAGSLLDVARVHAAVRSPGGRRGAHRGQGVRRRWAPPELQTTATVEAYDVALARPTSTDRAVRRKAGRSRRLTTPRRSANCGTMPTRRRPKPQEAMLGHITGYWVSQMIFVAASLGIADVLAKGPKTAAAIAEQVGAHGPFVYRVLRTLASLGVFAETPNGRFRLTPTAATLRSGVPGSLRDFALMMVDDYNWAAWGALLHGVKTGGVPFDRVHGQQAFEYLAAHPDKEKTFAASMASISGAENSAVARAYDFGRFGRLVDVGGAHGHLLATILRRHRKLRGVLYDQPQVVTDAAASGFLAGLEDRVEVTGGDFLNAVPAGADAYMMKYVLHDWDDDRCAALLGLCRGAMTPGGRVLVVENVVEPGNRPSWAKLLDINMMVLVTGRERTKAEFRDLFARAGLTLRRVVPTASPISVLEATAA